MIRPRGFFTFVEKLRQDFHQFQSIFVTNLNGSIVACSPNNEEDHNLYASLTLAWDDFLEIGTSKLIGGEQQGKSTLKYQIVEMQQFITVLTCIGDAESDLFILGVRFSDKKQLGYALQKLDVIKKLMEKELEEIIFNKLDNDN